MSHVESSVPKVISENPKFLKFRRRILNPHRVSSYENTWRRAVKASSYFIMAGAGIYMMLFSDWGEKEHVFSPLRRLYEEQRRRFLTLSEEDQRDLKYRSEQKTRKDPPGS
ncbi:hypothetical protein HDV05_007815 [Chytridiales sp. JEL 0842]|nr:hypothetical protein HDV05_007815 [Chytridiales sp. JEL 0842]